MKGMALMVLQSLLIISSAPSSIDFSMMSSSLLPGAKKIAPQCLKRKETQPSVPKLPPCLDSACLTSATASCLLSVKQSIMIAAPLMPYPS